MIPQTTTTMEACFTFVPGQEEDFGRAHDEMGPVAAQQPGFLSVLGGPIARSSWLYFSGKFASPEKMDKWHHEPAHRPVQEMARSKWFGSYYIRKWRLPADGEELSGRTFCEIAISRTEPLDEPAVGKLLAGLDESLAALGPLPFETMTGQFELQPYQFVGPLEEFPQVAPARYLLLTHWETGAAAQRWLDSDLVAGLAELGDVSAQLHVPIVHQPGERDRLRADGLQREWSADSAVTNS